MVDQLPVGNGFIFDTVCEKEAKNYAYCKQPRTWSWSMRFVMTIETCRLSSEKCLSRSNFVICFMFCEWICYFMLFSCRYCISVPGPFENQHFWRRYSPWIKLNPIKSTLFVNIFEYIVCNKSIFDWAEIILFSNHLCQQSFTVSDIFKRRTIEGWKRMLLRLPGR